MTGGFAVVASLIPRVLPPVVVFAEIVISDSAAGDAGSGGDRKRRCSKSKYMIVNSRQIGEVDGADAIPVHEAMEPTEIRRHDEPRRHLLAGELEVVDVGVRLSFSATDLSIAVDSAILLLFRIILMPGMIDTIVNLILNDEMVAGLVSKSGERFAYDLYRRFLDMFGNV
ncbi:hypothetical protein OROMI_014974 [Orobanche minor]